MATTYGTNSSDYIGWLSGASWGNDLIYALDGNDTVYASSGNDTIKGGGGADYINGGSGTDTSSYLDSWTGVTVNLATGKGYGGTAEGDTLVSIENLIGSQHNDTLTGNDGANTLIGADGNDILKGGGGADTLNGDAGDDTLKGGGGADTLNGGVGIDTASYNESSTGVFVWLAEDIAANGDAEGDNLNSIENLTGSAYNDSLWGDNGANVIQGLAGNDSLKGYGGADTLIGGDGNDQLYGGADNDTLKGDKGDDKLDGGTGNDAMTGGLGNDKYYVDSAGDTVTELAGQGTNDVVFSNIASYTLADNVEILSLADSLVGINGTGNAQGNTIFGNANNNVLNGGAGSDALSGLGGNDTFVFQKGQANGDVVYEFNGNGAAAGDVLQFSGYGTLAEGATFHQLTATVWQINSADGLTHELITLEAGSVIDTNFDIVFV